MLRPGAFDNPRSFSYHRHMTAVKAANLYQGTGCCCCPMGSSIAILPGSDGACQPAYNPLVPLRGILSFKIQNSKCFWCKALSYYPTGGLFLPRSTSVVTILNRLDNFGNSTTSQQQIVTGTHSLDPLMVF